MRTLLRLRLGRRRRSEHGSLVDFLLRVERKDDEKVFMLGCSLLLEKKKKTRLERGERNPNKEKREIRDFKLRN